VHNHLASIKIVRCKCWFTVQFGQSPQSPGSNRQDHPVSVSANEREAGCVGLCTESKVETSAVSIDVKLDE